MANDTLRTLEVRRDAWGETRLHERPRPTLGEGDVRIGVDFFALTANNITYAAAGDMLDYWGFFPTDEGWGRIPVMGYGDVLESAHPGVEVGTRVFGCLDS